MPPVQRVRVLASSSSGNATFVRLGDRRLLLDAGVPLQRIEDALNGIDERVDDLDAVLLTHEHTDHIQGLAALHARRPDLPIYCTPGTAKQLVRRCGVTLTRPLHANTPFEPLPGITVTPFALSHDASDPVGFRIHTPTCALALATDLGTWNEATERALRGCQLLLLEANYCPDLLAKSSYPSFLKRRIAGHRGHLSNLQTQRLLDRVLTPHLGRVILSHLSEENNLPATAEATVALALQRAERPDIHLAAAHRTQPSEPFDLPLLHTTPEPTLAARRLMTPNPQSQQLSLF